MKMGDVPNVLPMCFFVDALLDDGHLLWWCRYGHCLAFAQINDLIDFIKTNSY